MSIEQRIRGHFQASIKAKQDTLAAALPAIVAAAQLIVATIRAGGKVLVCGNGGSAADAQLFAAEFTGRFER
jgi:D-sedoheptulose 7-phosphate isomerase